MTTSTQLAAWLNGTPTGGPGADGRYPLTYADGQTYLVYCPAAQALNPALSEQPVELFTQQTEAAAANAAAAATAADADRISAQTAAANAAQSESLALGHKNAAAASATTASTKATEASTSATNAAGSATTAGTANTNAQAAKTASEAARDKAQLWADAGQDVPVEGAAYSAKHWAQKAQAAATGTLKYKGSWDATTAFPANPVLGDFWKVSVAGGIYNVGDQILYNGAGWDKIDNTEQVMSVAGRTGAVTLGIADVANLQTELALKVVNDTPGNALALGWVGNQIRARVDAYTVNLATIGGTPQFTDVRIGADSDVLLYEGAANQFNIRVGPSTAYKYFGFNVDGSFTTPFNMSAGGDVYAKDLRTDRGDGTGAVWFGGDGAGYLYRSGGTSFELRAGTSFYYLTSPGTVFTTGNFDPATKLNASNPTATGDLTTSGRIISNGAHFNSTAAAAVLSAAGGTVYLRPNGADSGSGEATLTTAGNFTAPGYIFAGGDIRGAALYPTNNNGAYMSGNGGGIQHNGNWYHNGPFFRLSANGASWVAQPRTFVSETDPGVLAGPGDVWIKPV